MAKSSSHQQEDLLSRLVTLFLKLCPHSLRRHGEHEFVYLDPPCELFWFPRWWLWQTIYLLKLP